MDKKALLGQLRTARSAQIQWRAFAQGLQDTPNLGYARESVINARARFDTWYFSHGRALAKLHSFQSVSAKVKQLHELTDKLTDMFERETEAAHFLSWFKSPPKSQRQLLNTLEELQRESVVLSTELEKLEQEVKGMSNSEVARFTEENSLTTDYDNSFLIN